jgi:Skp family chaperone for outer membrane proteins
MATEDAKTHYTCASRAGKTACAAPDRQLTGAVKAIKVDQRSAKDNVMLRPACRLPALVLVALLAAPASAQQLYKFVGPDGRVQYSDRPPAGAQKVEKVTSSRVSTIGSPGASGGEAGKAPKTAAEQEQAFRQRRAEAEEKAKKDEKLAQETKAKDAYCASARRELTSLQSGQRIVRTDDKGERVYLEDAQIQQEIARVQRDIAANCK